MVTSDVELISRTQFSFTMFNGPKWEASLPSFFFFREFFSSALLSECLEQASKLQLISPGLTNRRKGCCSRSCITRIEKKAIGIEVLVKILFTFTGF